MTAKDGKCTMADSVEEDLENRYFVLDGLEKGVEAQFSCELGPFVPLGVAGGGTAKRDSGVDGFRCSAKIVDERICNVGWTRRQCCF